MANSFAKYTTDAETHIRNVRSKIYQGDKLEQVTHMSMPFELKPVTSSCASSSDREAVHRIPSLNPNTKFKKGILLIHGFLTSPYIMKSLAEDFANQGFLVRAILLPGHGTEYQDLDNYTNQDWLAAAQFGYESLLEDCEEVSLCGFSIGATLSLMVALHALKTNKAEKLKNLILLAPCFGISPFAYSFPFLIKYHLAKLLPQLFCTQAEKEHLASYTKFSINSVAQIVKLLATLKIELRAYAAQQFPIPTFVVASKQDATVKFKPIINFANTYLNQESYLYVYNTYQKKLTINIPHTTININSSNKNILAMSHVAMPVNSTDAYFGNNGSYYGLLDAQIKFGEPQHMRHHIKRLTYNPDYLNLAKQIMSWLKANENDYHLQQN